MIRRRGRAVRLDDPALDSRPGSKSSPTEDRLALERAAWPILAGEDLSARSDRDIRVAVVKRVDGDDIPAERGDEYVQGRFEGAIARHRRRLVWRPS